MLTRERPRTSARILMPPPAVLPSLPEALARRAEIFGPFDLDEAPSASRGAAWSLGALVRRVVAALDPRCAP